jgi:hypothetical protein
LQLLSLMSTAKKRSLLQEAKLCSLVKVPLLSQCRQELRNVKNSAKANNKGDFDMIKIFRPNLSKSRLSLAFVEVLYIAEFLTMLESFYSFL